MVSTANPKHLASMPSICVPDDQGGTYGLQRCCYDAVVETTPAANSCPQCTQDVLEVCAAGQTFQNPCIAFCHGHWSFFSGPCSANRQLVCPEKWNDRFSEPLDAKLKNTNKYTILKTKVLTLEECAIACESYEGALKCQAFEYRDTNPDGGNKLCHLKYVGAFEQKHLPNDFWKLYTRTSTCVP